MIDIENLNLNPESITDYGQIALFDEYFSPDNAILPSMSPSDCIKYASSYIAIIDKISIPVMIGSAIHTRLHANDNPLRINGYFIINGKCKSVNNIKVQQKIICSTSFAILPNNRELHIKSMGNYYLTPRLVKDKYAKKYEWRLPTNYIDIAKCAQSPKDRIRILAHFTLVALNMTTLGPPCTDSLTQHIICDLFLKWIQINQNQNENKNKNNNAWRLITPPELFLITLRISNTRDCLLNAITTNNWPIGATSFPASDNMHHFNIIHDIEAIRRVTIIGDRDHMPSNVRLIHEQDKYKLCPAQTSDGSLTGTVSYISLGAKLMPTYITKPPIHLTPDDLVFYNGYWMRYGDKPRKNIAFTIAYTIDSKPIYSLLITRGVLEPSKNLLSYTPSLIPYFNHNPAVRCMFACSMIKQAISYESRKIYSLAGGKILANKPTSQIGNTLIVGVMPWYGYNVEDAIVLSKSAALKFTTIQYITYTLTDIILLEPNLELKIQQTIIHSNEVIAKYVHNNELKFLIPSFTAAETAIIDEFTYSNNTLFVRLKLYHLLEVGDKMASRHGQKGVVSLILPDEEMPYIYINNDINNKRHIELLINPHAFPSRMTIGQLIEMGNTPHKTYIPRKGQCKNDVIVGPCLYMALRHQVHAKVQGRSVGLLAPINNMPIQSHSNKSNKNDGGLRFGLMERAILIATRSYSTLKEFWSADLTTAYICSECYYISYLQRSNCICGANSTAFISTQCTKATLIIISVIRSCLYDVKWDPINHSYKITHLDISKYPSLELNDSINFGFNDIMDLRFRGIMPLLPTCLRTPSLNTLYKQNYAAKPKNIAIILSYHKKLLTGKNGLYHILIEGHKLNHSARSVIIPNPKLNPNTIALPKHLYIATTYGILNRQPSLSLSSFMAVNFIPANSNCIEINPLISAPFNADFDGDEMAVYGVTSRAAINEITKNFPVQTVETQDYKFSSYYKMKIDDLPLFGLTATKDHIMMMINAKSKGSLLNYNHIYNKLGDIYVCKKKVLHTSENYLNGLSLNTWYNQLLAAREAAISISINTPYTGGLYNKLIDRLT
jgi:hypothetical protein